MILALMMFLSVCEGTGTVITSTEDIVRVMQAEAKIDRECLWVLHLNPNMEIIEKELVSMGTQTATYAHPREVFRRAVIKGSTAIVTVHNHPGRSAKPSVQDKDMFKRLDEAGTIIGIKVVEHIILCSSGQYYSYRRGEVEYLPHDSGT